MRRRSFFESDNYENVFSPLIKDSTIYLDRLGKKRRNTKIIQAINVRSNSSDTSIYVRRVPREKGITAKSTGRACSCIGNLQHKCVEPLPQQTAEPNEIAFKSSDTKCQRNQPQAHKGEWKYVDPENLIKIEPTRYYVMLPPIRKLPEKKTKINDMCNAEKRLKNTAIEYLMSRKGPLRSEWPKLPKSSITTKTLIKSSDCNIMLDLKKLSCARNHGWTGSRIEWMLDLEHKQELRKKRQELWRATIAEENEMDICCFPFIRNVFVWHF